MLLGDNDGYLQRGDCRLLKVAAEKLDDRQIILLTVYPKVTHFYENPEYRKDSDPEMRKKLMGNADNFYNANAHQDSVGKVQMFLKNYL
ncbi:MAG: hypothetical protein GY786_04550 [Proteobacteria bacterium]|nr:hypothetical protein [Pseudomonadota bacterium]